LWDRSLKDFITPEADRADARMAPTT